MKWNNWTALATKYKFNFILVLITMQTNSIIRMTLILKFYNAIPWSSDEPIIIVRTINSNQRQSLISFVEKNNMKPLYIKN